MRKTIPASIWQSRRPLPRWKTTHCAGIQRSVPRQRELSKTPSCWWPGHGTRNVARWGYRRDCFPKRWRLQNATGNAVIGMVQEVIGFRADLDGELLAERGTVGA